jgi:hypothetical protein
MGSSAKITRGGNKKRINMGRQEKKIEQAKKKEVADSKKLKKRVRIEATPSGTVSGTVISQPQLAGNALASGKQVVANSAKRLQQQRSRTTAITMVPKESAASAPDAVSAE